MESEEDTVKKELDRCGKTDADRNMERLKPKVQLPEDRSYLVSGHSYLPAASLSADERRRLSSKATSEITLGRSGDRMYLRPNADAKVEVLREKRGLALPGKRDHDTMYLVERDTTALSDRINNEKRGRSRIVNGTEGGDSDGSSLSSIVKVVIVGAVIVAAAYYLYKRTTVVV